MVIENLYCLQLCLYHVWVLVAQSCLALCDPMNCSPQGSSVHRIFQARILEWVVIPFSRGSSWPRDRSHVSGHCRQILYHLSHQGSLPIPWRSHQHYECFKAKEKNLSNSKGKKDATEKERERLRETESMQPCLERQWDQESNLFSKGQKRKQP